MEKLAIIGGTGLTRLNGLEIIKKEMVRTPFGEPSGPLIHGRLEQCEIIFIARHGYKHTIPPHKINYRANIFSLSKCNVSHIIAINAVGGITPDCRPQSLVIPDQLIDYTADRKNTFYEEDLNEVIHIDFTQPYDPDLRQVLLKALRGIGCHYVDHGVYAATQGPRLETAAEIQRLEADGCTVVGMTGMPEAALARELEIAYASCCVVANWAAGIKPKAITMDEIQSNLAGGMEKVKQMLQKIIAES